MNSNQASHTGVGADHQQPAFLFHRNPHRVWEKRMDFDSLGEIIATRTLHLIDEHGHQRPVSVFIGKPEPADSGYKCSYQVIGIGSQETQSARGSDSIQALQAAMILAGSSLHKLNQEVGGKLSWNGDAAGNLGFPADI